MNDRAQWFFRLLMPPAFAWVRTALRLTPALILFELGHTGYARMFLVMAIFSLIATVEIQVSKEIAMAFASLKKLFIRPKETPKAEETAPPPIFRKQDPRAPNLIGVGAPHCGADILRETLSQSPSVYIAPEEINYFSRWFKDWKPDRYFALFGDRPEPVRAEISTGYLYVSPIPSRIASLCPEAQVVIQVRNPVERAIAHYAATAKGNVAVALEEALETLQEIGPNAFIPWNDPARILQGSFYRPAIERFQKYIAADRLHVVFYEDLLNDPEAALDPIASALNIQLRAPAHVEIEPLPPIDESLHSRLADFFAEDWEWTQKLRRQPQTSTTLNRHVSPEFASVQAN